MAKTSKSFILLLALSFLIGRIAAPMPVQAADKITKASPEFLSTPPEDIENLVTEKEKIKPATWIAVLAGLALVAALGGGGGGGGGGGSSTSPTSGDVTVDW